MRYAVKSWLVTGVCFASASVVHADVLTVGNGGFPDLQSAVDAAVDGDVILLQASFSSATVIDGKSVTVLGDASMPVVEGLEVRNVVIGQEIALVNLEIKGSPDVASKGLVLEACGVGIRVDNCEISGSEPPPCDPFFVTGDLGVAIDHCSDVVFSDCTIRGGSGSSTSDDFGFCPGLGAGKLACRAVSSSVAFYECKIFGGWGGSDSTNIDPIGKNAGAGLLVRSGFAYISGGSIKGGNGGVGLGDADCYFAGGGAGGTGLRLQLGATVVAVDVAIDGGAGGTAGFCDDVQGGPPGVPISVSANSSYTDLGNTARSIDVENPAFELAPTMITARGVPGDDVYLVLTKKTEFTYPHPIPSIVGPKLYAQPVVRRFFVGTLDATGELTTAVPNPPLPPNTSDVTWFWQGAFDDGNSIWTTDSEAWIRLDDALQGP